MVAAAEGDAFLVGEGDDVVGVDFGEMEADDAGTVFAGAENADSFEAGELVEGVFSEFLVVAEDFGAAEGVEIIHGGVEADGSGDVRGAGFEAEGGGFVLALVEIDVGDHFAAAVEGGEGVEELFASVECADAGGAAHFVSGNGEEIAADLLDVERAVSGALGGVDEGDDVFFAGFAAEFGGGIDGAEGVGNVGEGEDFGGGELLVEAGEIEEAFVAGDGDEIQFRAGALGEELPRDDVAVVLHFGEEDGVAGLEEGVAPGAGEEVYGFGGAAGEDDFAGGGGVEELGGAFAGGFVGDGGAVAEGVDAAVDVAVVVFVVVAEGVDDLAGFLGGGGAVEVDERVFVDLLVEDREIVADVFPGNFWRGGWRGHVAER